MINFDTAFFRKNRQRLVHAIPDSLVLIPANCLLQESADLAYSFRQDSNFWYLTGLQNPDLLLVIDTKKNESVVLVPSRNDYQIEWEGEVLHDEYVAVSGVERVCERAEIVQIVEGAKKRNLHICYLEPLADRVEPYGFYSNPARRLLESELRTLRVEPKDVRLELARLRQQKQPEEIEAIKEAIRITGESLAVVKKRLAEFKTEKELERAITAEFYARGADGHAYQPIVASGKNAAVIHYEANPRNHIESDAMLLLDVGAKVQGYAADISRTWAIGHVSDRQKAVFAATIRLQDTAFTLLRSGVIMKEYQETMEHEAAKAIKKLGCVKKKYPHGFSHFLGLDVHDAGDYQKPLSAGSIITVEPGLYFPDEAVGVRIEDDVLITPDGIENLSEMIPRTL
jgi:Xaa-Pro aminopeptidase